MLIDTTAKRRSARGRHAREVASIFTRIGSPGLGWNTFTLLRPALNEETGQPIAAQVPLPPRGVHYSDIPERTACLAAPRDRDPRYAEKREDCSDEDDFDDCMGYDPFGGHGHDSDDFDDDCMGDPFGGHGHGSDSNDDYIGDPFGEYA